MYQDSDFYMANILGLKRQGHQLFLLSNSNEIHRDYIQSLYCKQFIELFNEQFYSYEIKLAKPDIKVFEHIVLKHKLKADECLFLDDNDKNIRAAITAGMSAIQFTVHDSIARIETILNPQHIPTRVEQYDPQVSVFTI